MMTWICMIWRFMELAKKYLRVDRAMHAMTHRLNAIARLMVTVYH